jgi:hypothetical protein
MLTDTCATAGALQEANHFNRALRATLDLCHQSLERKLPPQAE